ncbi:hypothetical protein QR98_0031000 [Sarcoptes scabiei]|nr:hypothetical protein QR98_0031000 [Sarcoptes scabiei]
MVGGTSTCYTSSSSSSTSSISNRTIVSSASKAFNGNDGLSKGIKRPRLADIQEYRFQINLNGMKNVHSTFINTDGKIKIIDGKDCGQIRRMPSPSSSNQSRMQTQSIAKQLRLRRRSRSFNNLMTFVSER